MQFRLSFFLVSLCIASAALAHGSGQSFDERIGDRFVDIGFDPILQVGEETLIDFALYDMEGGTNLGLSKFTGISVTLSSGSTIQWETSFDKPDFGKAFATVTPSASGNWDLSVTFENDGTEVISATFTAPILPPAVEENSGVNIAMWTGVAVAIAAVLGFRSFRSS